MATKKSSKKSKDEDKKKSKSSSKSKSKSSSKDKKASKKVASKKRVKKEVPELKVIKKSYTHTELIGKLAEKLEDVHKSLEDQDALCRKIVKNVLENYTNIVAGSLAPKGVGEIKLFNGLFKAKVVKVKPKKMPAIKKGTMVMNPFEGKEVPHKGRKAFTKPGFNRIKVLPMKKMKDIANDE